MRVPEVHDFGRDQIDIWTSRLGRFKRVAGFILDLFHGFLLVAFLALIGATTGGLIGATWGGFGFLLGLIAGGALGSVAGIAWAKRVFFGGRKPATQPPATATVPVKLSPGAYRWPGVEEQFGRMRKRGILLVLLMGAALLLVYYLHGADQWHLPIPYSLPLLTLEWALVGFMVVLALLMALNARCPKCRRLLWQAAKLHQCPHCGVVLRDSLF